MLLSGPTAEWECQPDSEFIKEARPLNAVDLVRERLQPGKLLGFFPQLDRSFSDLDCVWDGATLFRKLVAGAAGARSSPAARCGRHRLSCSRPPVSAEPRPVLASKCDGRAEIVVAVRSCAWCIVAHSPSPSVGTACTLKASRSNLVIPSLIGEVIEWPSLV